MLTSGNTNSTLRLSDVYTKLKQIASKAKQEPDVAFTSLAHLITPDFLRVSFYRLRKEAAPGVDGVTWQEYQEGLDGRLKDLHSRLKSGQYRAQPVRRVNIPKENGQLRPLGITSLEDKIVQRAVVTILEAIYEVDFYDCSYGFRPNCNPQQALNTIREMIYAGQASYILDADIKGYFDNIVRSQLMEFLERRVKDRTLLRLIGKWLHVGVLDDGELLLADKGTPQGSVISPILANIYLHYVLDEWIHKTVEPRLEGPIKLVRYADDFILGIEHPRDAERVYEALQKRMQRFGLELHPDKTRIIRFGPGAQKEAERQGRDRPDTFDFLGFTHISGKTRTGRFGLLVKTMARRLNRSVQRVRLWCRQNRHLPIRKQRDHLAAMLRGHYVYYGRRMNYRSLNGYYREVRRQWRYWLNRRDERRHCTWKKFVQLVDRFPLPLPRIQERPETQLRLKLGRL